MNKELKYTIERKFKLKGGEVVLIHTLELAKPYLCTFRLPGRSEESAFCYITDDFMTAHKAYNNFVKKLKSFIPSQNI